MVGRVKVQGLLRQGPWFSYCLYPCSHIYCSENLKELWFGSVYLGIYDILDIQTFKHFTSHVRGNLKLLLWFLHWEFQDRMTKALNIWRRERGGEGVSWNPYPLLSPRTPASVPQAWRPKWWTHWHSLRRALGDWWHFWLRLLCVCGNREWGETTNLRRTPHPTERPGRLGDKQSS